jgi:hypothetical protein
VTTPSPDLPDWAAGQQAVTVPTPLGQIAVPSGGSSAFIDVSAFSSVFIAGKNTGGKPVFAQFVNDKSGSFEEALGTSPLVSNACLLNCTGRYLFLIDILNTGASTFEIYGFGRDYGDPRAIVAGHASEPWTGTTGSFAWTVGETQEVAPNQTATLFQGLTFIHVRLSTAAATGFLYSQTLAGVDMPIVDSAQMFAAAQGGQVYNGLIALPANVAALNWTSESANTYTVTVQMCPAW